MAPRTVPAGKEAHAYGQELMAEYHVRTDIKSEPGFEKQPNPITNCSTCHY
jgi:hypothetical protein